MEGFGVERMGFGLVLSSSLGLTIDSEQKIASSDLGFGVFERSTVFFEQTEQGAHTYTTY